MPRLTRFLPVAAVLLAAAALQLAAYWPGIMYWDAVRQYGQAVSGAFDDWHPPAMEWVWRRMIALVGPGPAPMLLLQLALYWIGFALLSARALAAGRSRLAALIALAALMPFALATMGSVLKDSLMAGALLSAAGLAVWADRAGWRARLPAIVLLLFAGTLRFNALLAALPLLVAVLPPDWRRGWGRLALSTLVGGVALAVAMPLANHATAAKPSGVALSLVIFDLGGITEASGVDAFPPLPVADPVAVNHHCYNPVRWDSYAWWVDAPCPIGFALIRDTFAAHHQSPYVFWAEAIAAHPLAYAAHRLRHTNINTRFLVGNEIERPVQPQSAPNDWGFAISQNGLERAFDWVAVQSCRTPLGWPVCWIALALGLIFVGRGLPGAGIALPLALSSALYGGGYLVLSVASDLRYHLWTMLAAAVAFVIVADSAWRAQERRRLLLGMLPAIGVAVIAGAARLIW